MEFIYEYGLFLAQAITFVAAILIVVSAVVSIGMRQKAGLQEGHIEIRDLNDKYDHIGAAIREVVDDPGALKVQRKADRKADKVKAKAAKKKRKGAVAAKTDERRNRLYVLGFDGDIRASAVSNLREEISVILTMATERDEVVVKLDSGGGMVHSYGLASSQLDRLRESLTLCLPDCWPRAGAVCRLAEAWLEHNKPLPAAQAQPMYIRDKVAEKPA